LSRGTDKVPEVLATIAYHGGRQFDRGEKSMPLINVEVIEGVFSDDEKQMLIHELAAVFGKVAGQWMRDNTSVRIHEVRSGHWGGADVIRTTEWARQMKSDPV
jgi:4-oxalocrotonate tautomerase